MYTSFNVILFFRAKVDVLLIFFQCEFSIFSHFHFFRISENKHQRIFDKVEAFDDSFFLILCIQYSFAVVFNFLAFFFHGVPSLILKLFAFFSSILFILLPSIIRLFFAVIIPLFSSLHLFSFLFTIFILFSSSHTLLLTSFFLQNKVHRRYSLTLQYLYALLPPPYYD